MSAPATHNLASDLTDTRSSATSGAKAHRAAASPSAAAQEVRAASGPASTKSGRPLSRSSAGPSVSGPVSRACRSQCAGSSRSAGSAVPASIVDTTVSRGAPDSVVDSILP